MDHPTFFLVLSFLLTCFYALTVFRRRNSRLPPGPFPLPVIGNLLQVNPDKPHRSLATLSKRYGPFMSLKLGSRTTIVISSPNLAKEFFLTHDMSFSSRSLPDTARVVDHDKYSVAWLSVGDQWRRQRRLLKEYLYPVQRLEAIDLLLGKKVQELLDHVNQCCKHEKPVNIGAAMFTTLLNIISNLVCSMDFAQYDSATSQEFKEAVCGLMEIAGKPNIADFFPILKLFDPQGLIRRGNVYGKKLLAILDQIIDQRIHTRSSSSSCDGVSSTNNDILDSLLDLNLKGRSESLSRDDMKHWVMDLFIGGTDTTSTTLEWAMAELIRNPGKKETARLEVINLMQNINRNIQEPDINQLPYLQAVIKETLRLHPPAPLLVPHQAMQDVNVQGFTVPKNAQILCNIWGMGRDPSIWSNPETFMPERFLEADISYKGQDFEFIPFGTGRRICPGMNVAHRVLPLVLGSLIQKFDWKLEGNKRVQDLDMEEKFGLSLPRRVPLMAIPIKP
ncbi:geraniol 8-hydroxylase-like [Cynara cardunculus var. scolymus]|uniref:Cytochrome P450 n=1 Tax=Cynara cardunculus var. scolymus TaxID=59895 RepID=A0A124SB09_CYNCS|nr:geraniol 8-hydroxylase-like [Cynara cardunculus var. scolymus]KVH89171.1 cytochrome P450 [Cynara cardunculus var. scolymus]